MELQEQKNDFIYRWIAKVTQARAIQSLQFPLSYRPFWFARLSNNFATFSKPVDVKTKQAANEKFLNFCNIKFW